MTTSNLNITPVRVAVVAAFQGGHTAKTLSNITGLSVSSVYRLTGDVRFVRAARKVNKGRVTVR